MGKRWSPRGRNGEICAAQTSSSSFTYGANRIRVAAREKKSDCDAKTEREGEVYREYSYPLRPEEPLFTIVGTFAVKYVP